MTQKKHFRGLFFNAVLALTLISLVLFLVLGRFWTQKNSRILQHEILQKQQLAAARLASVVQLYVNHVSEHITVFTDLHTDFGGHAFLNQQDLAYLRRKNSSISYLGLFNSTGKLLFSVGQSSLGTRVSHILPEIQASCIRHGTNYTGQPYVSAPGEWFLPLAFPVYRYQRDEKPSGILLAQVNLMGLRKTLAQTYPLDMDAFLVNDKHEAIFYNGAPEGLPSPKQQQLTRQIQTIQEQLAGRSAGEVVLPNGEKWLVSTVNVILSGWKFYVAQPFRPDSPFVPTGKNQSHSDIISIVLLMLLFVIGVSYWVIVPITRPLERLRTVALRLREGDYVIRPGDVEIPPNEIGELAEVLMEASVSLHQRQDELLTAQRELAHANKMLEQRVEERSRELSVASSELVKAERLAAIGQMASIISHEIRNPLAVISNAARLIKLLIKTPDLKITKQLGIIEAEIKQANGIISEVLGYARSRDLILNVVEVSSYVRDIMVSYPLPEGVKWQDRLSTLSAHIKIDTEEMKQAIQNLVTNAVEAMQGQGTLTVGTKAGRSVVCIYVADTGPGIDEELRSKIFSPFFTTKARGTGLGLAVVGKVVGRHQGKLFMTSQTGKGTCFQIYLKIYRRPGDTRYGTTREDFSRR